jgi:hypothetical protein
MNLKAMPEEKSIQYDLIGFIPLDDKKENCVTQKKEKTARVTQIEFPEQFI